MVLDLDSAMQWLEGSRGPLGVLFGRLSPQGDFYKPSLASPKETWTARGDDISPTFLIVRGGNETAQGPTFPSGLEFDLFLFTM